MEDAGPPAAAATGEDWRSQIDPMARQVMVKQMFMTLRLQLPVSDEEGRSRHQKLAEGFELKFYNEASNKDSYKRKLAMLLIYVKNMNQNSHLQASGLPPQGNDPAQSSGFPLMSNQDTRQPNNSTSVQDSYLPNLGQSLTGGGQAFTLQNISGQSTIPYMQSAIQSGTQQNSLNVGQQPMQSLCQQSPQYPQLSMNQQPSLQRTRLIQEPSFPVEQEQQESMVQQPNLHQIQLICQHNYAVDMQQQHRLPVQSICLNPPHPDNNDVPVPHVSTENFGNFGFAVAPDLAMRHTLASETSNLTDPLASSCSGVQLGTNNADREHVMPTDPEKENDILFSRYEDSTFLDELDALCTLDSPPSLFSVNGAQDEKCMTIVGDSDFHVGSSPFYAEHEFTQFTGTEIGNEEYSAAMLSSLSSGTQMENTENEVPNFESMADGAVNRNKRKFDHISS